MKWLKLAFLVRLTGPNKLSKNKKLTKNRSKLRVRQHHRGAPSKQIHLSKFYLNNLSLETPHNKLLTLKVGIMSFLEFLQRLEVIRCLTVRHLTQVTSLFYKRHTQSSKTSWSSHVMKSLQEKIFHMIGTSSASGKTLLRALISNQSLTTKKLLPVRGSKTLKVL